jgi:hypothetical protein
LPVVGPTTLRDPTFSCSNVRFDWDAHSKAGAVAVAETEDEPMTLTVMSLEEAENGEAPVIDTDSSWIVALVPLKLMKFESVVPITRTIPNEGVTEAEPHVKTPSVARRLPTEMLQTSLMTRTLEAQTLSPSGSLLKFPSVGRASSR